MTIKKTFECVRQVRAPVDTREVDLTRPLSSPCLLGVRNALDAPPPYYFIKSDLYEETVETVANVFLLRTCNSSTLHQNNQRE